MSWKYRISDLKVSGSSAYIAWNCRDRTSAVEEFASKVVMPNLEAPEDLSYSLPTPLAPFYAHILSKQTIPTLRELWLEYVAMYGTPNQTSSHDISNVPKNVIAWQIYGSYGQMIRRHHLFLKLQESGLFDKVVFSFKNYVQYNIAFELTFGGKTYWVFANDDEQEIDANRLPQELPSNVFTASLTLPRPKEVQEGGIGLYPPETTQFIFDNLSLLAPLLP